MLWMSSKRKLLHLLLSSLLLVQLGALLLQLMTCFLLGNQF